MAMLHAPFKCWNCRSVSVEQFCATMQKSINRYFGVHAQIKRVKLKKYRRVIGFYYHCGKNGRRINIIKLCIWSENRCDKGQVCMLLDKGWTGMFLDAMAFNQKKPSLTLVAKGNGSLKLGKSPGRGKNAKPERLPDVQAAAADQRKEECEELRT